MKLAIEGMHCDGCVQRVRKAVAKIEGARIESVEVGSAVVAVDPKREDVVLDAVNKLGFEARKVE